MIDVIKDTLFDSIKLLPFLFLAYLLMEYLEHKTGNKTKGIVKKSGKLGPLWGGIIGIFPQCGFSAAAANLYAGKIITMGTLIAVFLSTSDEMLPILISEAAPASLILKILAIKLVVGIIAGFIIDLVINVIGKTKKVEPEEAVGHMCEHDHCDCEHGIFKSALKHTINIFNKYSNSFYWRRNNRKSYCGCASTWNTCIFNIWANTKLCRFCNNNRIVFIKPNKLWFNDSRTSSRLWNRNISTI